MQSKTYCTLFLCLIVATIVSAAPSTSGSTPSTLGRQCVAGKSYHDGCNFCRCAGEIPICTAKACIVYDNNLKDYVPLLTKEAPEDFWMPIQA